MIRLETGGGLLSGVARETRTEGRIPYRLSVRIEDDSLEGGAYLLG